MMNEQVLEPSKYPDIIFDAQSISIVRIDAALFSATLNGALTFRGITRNQTIAARIAVFDDMLRASGEFTLIQSDFGVKPISVAGGALKVKDELKLSFEMVARKQD
jgi:polyisoprenoid-binding protein YceI